MLSNETLAQLRGLKQLLDDGFSAGLDATEKLHQDIAARPYRWLEKVEPIARPAQAVGTLQSGITHGIYAAIRGVHRVGSGLADGVITLAEAQRKPRL